MYTFSCPIVFLLYFFCCHVGLYYYILLSWLVTLHLVFVWRKMFIYKTLGVFYPNCTISLLHSFLFLCLNWWLLCFLTAELHWNEWSHPIMASGFNWLAVSSQCHNLIMIFKCHGLVARRRYTQDGTGSLSQSTTLRWEARLMLMFCLLLLEYWVICSARGCFRKMSTWFSRMKRGHSKQRAFSSFKRVYTQKKQGLVGKDKT